MYLIFNREDDKMEISTPYFRYRKKGEGLRKRVGGMMKQREREREFEGKCLAHGEGGEDNLKNKSL